MKISHNMGIVFLACVALATVLGALFLLSFLLPHEGDFSDAVKKTEMSRIKASAKIYYSRLQFYDGVCNDVVSGLSPEYVCNDISDGFAVAIRLANSSYYCTDATGFLGDISHPIGSSVRCKLK